MHWIEQLVRKVRARSVRAAEEATAVPEEKRIERVASHLKSYLDFYRTCQNPGYAVLVTGEWGTGKTFQVRGAIPDEDAYYVSLFGLNEPDDVIAAVYAAMYPRQAWIKRHAERVNEVGLEVGGVGSLAVGGVTSALVGAFLRQQVISDKPIIFDDLERCALSVKEKLGLINLYVEHHGCRVIVIAHDEKMEEEFVSAKEKIFGQTIRVEAQIEEAFDSFNSSLIDDIGKEFVGKYRAEVIGIFRESTVKSLRILRHIIEDLARLAPIIELRFRKHDQAMVDLVRLFVAFDIEVRAGRLRREDFYNRENVKTRFDVRRALGKDEAVEIPPIRTADERYGSTQLTSTLLQDDVLCELFIDGRYSRESISASLQASPYYIEPTNAPPWKLVMNFDELEDGVVADALEKMQGQFENREITETGELLHFFALQMMLAAKDVIGKSLEQVEKDCMSYIDDLLRQKRLPPRDLGWEWKRKIDLRASHGFAYWVSDEYRDRFVSVGNYLRDAKVKALEVEFPSLIPDLLKTLEADGLQFFEQVCNTATGSNRYAAIPILASIPPREFVGAWLRSPKHGWRWVSRALEERHRVAPTHDLAAEKIWIEEVGAMMTNEAKKVSGLARFRIERIIPKVLEQ